MKTLLIYCLWLGSAATALAQIPATFAEFKQLPAEQRDLLVANESASIYNPLRLKVLNWWVRLNIGEDAWLWKEQERLTDHNHHIELASFFNTYQHFRASCLKQEWTKKNAQGVSPSEQPGEGEHFAAKARADSTIYHDMVPVLATLAPSAEAKALNDQVAQYSADLYARYPDGVLSRGEMTEIDRREKEIVDQINRLPKLTAEQVQAAIEVMPEDPSQPHGLPYPRK